MARIVGLLDMDYFYAQIEERENPEWKNRPVIVCVYSGRTPDSGSVATCNYQARELGIHSAMPIFRAKQLAKTADPVFLPARIPAYREVSKRVMEIVGRFTDGIETVGLDEAYFDLSKKSGGDWNAAERRAREIKQAIRANERLSCSIGLGPNKLVAKMACKAKKPDGLTVVPAERAQGFLEPQPVRKLHGVGPKTALALESKGARTVKELRNLSSERLVEWFGPARGTYLFNAARGLDDRPVETSRERKQIARMATLSADAGDLETLLDHLQPLWIDVCAQLKQRELSAKTWSIVLVTDALETHSKSRTLTDGTNDESHATAIVRELAEKFLAAHAKSRIRRAGVSASQLAGLGEKKAQRGLADFA